MKKEMGVSWGRTLHFILKNLVLVGGSNYFEEGHGPSKFVVELYQRGKKLS